MKVANFTKTNIIYSSPMCHGVYTFIIALKSLWVTLLIMSTSSAARENKLLN